MNCVTVRIFKFWGNVCKHCKASYYRHILRWIFTYKIEKKTKKNGDRLHTDHPGVKWMASCWALHSIMRHLLHSRMVSVKFVTVYLFLLPLPRDKFMKGHTKVQLQCNWASPAGFPSTLFGILHVDIWNEMVWEETSGFQLAWHMVWKLCDGFFFDENCLGAGLVRIQLSTLVSLLYA